MLPTLLVQGPRLRSSSLQGAAESASREGADVPTTTLMCSQSIQDFWGSPQGQIQVPPCGCLLLGGLAEAHFTLTQGLPTPLSPTPILPGVKRPVLCVGGPLSSEMIPLPRPMSSDPGRAPSSHRTPKSSTALCLLSVLERTQARLSLSVYLVQIDTCCTGETAWAFGWG